MSNSVCLPTVRLYQSNKQGHITKTNLTKKKKKKKKSISKMTYDYNCRYCSLVFCCVLLYESHSSDTCTIIIYFHAVLLPVARQPPHRSYFPREFEFISLWSDEHSRGSNCRSAAVEIVILWLNTFLIHTTVDSYLSLSQGKHCTSSFSLSERIPGGKSRGRISHR